MSLRIKMVGATDVGRRRKSNQDSLYYDEPAGFGIVADGIGGRSGGEIASSLAVNGLRKSFISSDKIRHEEVNPFLISSIDRANAEIIDRGKREAEITGMGTTLNCIMFVGDRVHIAHIGDSRTYLYYKQHLFQLTFDHSVGNFVAKGWLPKQAIQPGAKDSALVKALGLTDQCEADIYELVARPGYLFVTCSDGLSGMLSDRKIAQIIADNQHRFKDLPKILIEAANSAGGRDNITVLLSQVKEAA